MKKLAIVFWLITVFGMISFVVGEIFSPAAKIMLDDQAFARTSYDHSYSPSASVKSNQPEQQ
jgi:xanthosine utilization system XapX-like protein